MKKTREKMKKKKTFLYRKMIEIQWDSAANIILYEMRCNEHSTLSSECDKLPDLKFIAQNSIWVAWKPTKEFCSNYSLTNVMFPFIDLSFRISFLSFRIISEEFLLEFSVLFLFYIKINYTVSHKTHKSLTYTSNIRHDGKLEF